MPPPSKKKRKSQVGTIFKVRLKNFMCYGETGHEFYPGDKFNVILGPNGSGKSTLVTAISICLGGEINKLKRQKSLKDLVKNTASKDEKAEVEIWLRKGQLDEETNQPVFEKIMCKISKTSIREAEHFLNGQRVDRKRIILVAAQYQIQTTNLCQFLPQEVVREFPQMKPKEILNSTLKAVGKMDMMEHHKALMEKQELKDKDEQTLHHKESTCKDLENQLKNKEHLRERVQKRKRFEEDLKLHQSQCTYLELLDLLRKISSSKKKVDDTQGKKKEAEDKKNALEKKKKQYQAKRMDLLDTSKTLNGIIAKANQNNVEPKPQIIEKQIEDIDVELRALEESKISAQEQLQNLRAEEEKKKQNLAALDLEETDKKLQKTNKEIVNLNASIDEITVQLNEISSKIAVGNTKITDFEAQIEKVKSIDSKKLIKLKSINADAYNGVLWLRNNRDKFKKPVHEPIMTLLNVKNKDLMVQLEDSIGIQEMETFVCEDANDTNTLMNQLRVEQRLHRINVVHSNPHENANFANPPCDSSAVFLDKVIDCPPAVKKHLCLKKKLHCVPVFKKDPANDYGLRKYYVDRKRVTISKSKYSNNSSKSVDSSLEGKSPRFLISDMNCSETDEEINRITKDIEEQKLQIKQHEANFERRFEHRKSKEMERNALQTTQLILADKKQNLFRLQQEVKEIGRKIDSIEKQPSIEDRKENCVVRRQELVTSLIQANKDLLASIKESNIAHVKWELNNLALDQLENQCQDDLKKHDEAVAKWDIICEDEKRYKNEEKDYRQQFENKRKQITWKEVKPGSIQMPDDLKNEIAGTCPETLSECKAKLLDLTDRLGKMPKVSERELIEIENLEKRLENQGKEVERLKKSVCEKTKELRHSETQLLHDIQELINDINQSFRDLMEKMDFAGEVQLRKGDHDLDFKNLGLEILVKFRDTDKLQALSSSVQSGGEKSVTTALYMMALQDFTQVPFRCVDEINQGMDECNERRVWEILVDTANQHSAQFFYLAPKYPQGLEFEKNMHIHMCFNGEVDLEKKLHLNLNDVISTYKKRSSNAA